MPDFKGRTVIVLQPADSEIPFNYIFSTCSSAIANDGSLPYGVSISSMEVKAHKEIGTDVTSELIATSSFSGLVVTAKLKYPATSGVGIYHLTIKLTLSSGAMINFKFNRIMAADK